jgi:hypothetical protein
MRRPVLARVVLGTAIVAAGLATWAALNTTALRAKLADRQLRSATNDEARTRAAERLASLGDHGLARLVEFIRAGNDDTRAAAVAAIDRRLMSMPDSDSWIVAAADRLSRAIPSAESAGQMAILELVPNGLKHSSETIAASWRAAIAAGLGSPEARVRVLAARLAIHPRVRMHREVVTLLADPAAEVRCAALVATAMPGESEPLIADEDLFRWLHDPDERVRAICHSALVSRERSEAEITRGRQLTSPDPHERLQLLLDLRLDEDLADPEPWLERLSRDSEPGVRAGAARVAVEITSERRLSNPTWVVRVAESDPDATVRKVVHFFRSAQTSMTGTEVRPGRAR